MVRRMQEAGVPARLTYSAGTFLCNHIMYSVLHLVAGFIHVPPTPELVVESDRAQPSMAVETIQTGVMAVAESLNVLAS